MPRPKQNEHTREALIEVGIKHISQHGYHGTGIKQILDELKVPKGSFYNYFSSKEAFVAELLEADMHNHAQQIQPVLDNNQLDPIEKLRTLFENNRQKYTQQQGKQGCLVASVANDIGDSSLLCQQAMQRSVKALNQLLAGLIAEAQQQQLIRTDLAASQLATLMWTAWEGSLIEMKIAGNTDNLTQITDFIFNDILKST
ncbi:MAG: TetR/AcrR family transcriptional repressor of nem operon [Moritella sp.]|jgi:TetR/AcrR family transcriptional repressor of nem operon